MIRGGDCTLQLEGEKISCLTEENLVSLRFATGRKRKWVWIVWLISLVSKHCQTSIFTFSDVLAGKCGLDGEEDVFAFSNNIVKIFTFSYNVFKIFTISISFSRFSPCTKITFIYFGNNQEVRLLLFVYFLEYRYLKPVLLYQIFVCPHTQIQLVIIYIRKISLHKSKSDLVRRILRLKNSPYTYKLSIL